MKKQLLFFLLLLSVMGSAQIVNIPDADFKDLLVQSGDPGFTDIAKDENNYTLAIDANNDGEIQVSEAEAVWHININMQGTVSSIEGIDAFVNLRTLRLKNNPVETIDVTSLEFLENLTCGNYNNSEDLTTLNVTGMSTLKELHCSDNSLTVLDLTGLINIEYLSCKNSTISSVILDDNINLKNINLSETAITTLDLTGYVNLENLNVYHSQLTQLNLENCVSLIELYCNSTPIQNLDISPCVSLEWIECGGTDATPLESVTIGELPALFSFYGDVYGVTELDFSECPNLEGVSLENFNEIYVNIKNGSTQGISLIDSTEASVFFCVDEDEELTFPLYYQENPNYHFSSYCSFTPGGNYNTITGNFTFDGDNNGCDIDDSFSTMVKVNINDGTESGSTFSNNNGSYNFYTESGTFTLTPQFENDWFTVTPSTATVTFADDNNNVETQNFCVTPNGEHPDVEVVIVPTIPAQPGFNASYNITYRNKGNQILSGNVFLTYDETVLDYVSSTSGVAASTNTFGWSYTDLQPFETRNIYLTLKVNAPTDTPAVNIDDILMFTANVTTEADNDENSDDNTFVLAQTIVGSYDPNDITCLEGEAIHVDKIGDYLHYNINFENTGTAPATFVVVKNEINEEQFDVSTLQLMDASHNVETRMTGNTIEFYFGDINLAANGGKGNVLFKIKTLDTLQEDDIVMQQANIYFDYNFPIETNEANTTFATLSNTVFRKDNTVTLYPNPSKDIVNIKANATITSVQLYDVQGRLLQTKKVNDVDVQLDISVQPSGLYFVKITTENGAKVEKLVKE